MMKIDNSKRKLLSLGGVTALAIAAPTSWTKPLVNSVMLPAHAQTSALDPMMCTTVTTVGGPLQGNASGATTCQAACEDEAAAQNAELCDVRETATATGTDCACDFDLP